MKDTTLLSPTFIKSDEKHLTSDLLYHSEPM